MAFEGPKEPQYQVSCKFSHTTGRYVVSIWSESGSALYRKSVVELLPDEEKPSFQTFSGFDNPTPSEPSNCVETVYKMFVKIETYKSFPKVVVHLIEKKFTYNLDEERSLLDETLFAELSAEVTPGKEPVRVLKR
jgi:hypothetical protein